MAVYHHQTDVYMSLLLPYANRNEEDAANALSPDVSLTEILHLKDLFMNQNLITHLLSCCQHPVI